jgi:hypothetical protein
MLLIGSVALELNLQRRGLSPLRKSKDTDIICTYDDFEQFHISNEFVHVEPMQKGKKIHAIDRARRHWEFELAWEETTSEALISLVKGDPDVFVGEIPTPNGGRAGLPVASLDILYMLKMSHRYLKDSPHFKKTMDDIKFMRTLGAKIPDRYREWFKKREDETYWYRHPNLNQKKSDFFNPNEGVKYVYDHDSIHQAVAFPLAPAYTLYMKDNEPVLCDKEKFFSLPHEVRLRGVIEEAYVLALERSQIPHGDKVPPAWSFETALRKVASSITSGWFREYAWENFDEAMATYDKNYVDRLKRGLENGIVKPYDSGNDYRSQA